MIPSGVILLWSGSIGSIPAGYVLCDGNNGTPDLRNRFIIGAGSSFDVDDTGGSNVHTHPFQGSGHTHDLPAGGQVATGANWSGTTSQAVVVGTTGNGNNLPPWYALAYIMKV